MPRTEILLGQTPPSLNTSIYAGRWKNRRLKRDWQNDIELLLMASELPLGDVGRVAASAVLRFPQRRRRDAGNHAWLLEKCIADALVGDPRAWPGGRWLPDDTPEFFTWNGVAFDSQTGPSRTLVFLDWERR